MFYEPARRTKNETFSLQTQIKVQKTMHGVYLTVCMCFSLKTGFNGTMKITPVMRYHMPKNDEVPTQSFDKTYKRMDDTPNALQIITLRAGIHFFHELSSCSPAGLRFSPFELILRHVTILRPLIAP
jgi:hypothetical protein